MDKIKKKEQKPEDLKGTFDRGDSLYAFRDVAAEDFSSSLTEQFDKAMAGLEKAISNFDAEFNKNHPIDKNNDIEVTR